MVDLDLGCVASFLVLLEEHHYGRAADRLNVTPSALTKRIQRLETQVGAQLLQRGTSGVLGPTNAGARFAEGAGRLLEQAEAAARGARRAQLSHAVTLGVPRAVGEFPVRHELAAIGRELRHSCPDLRLRLRGVPFEQLTSALLERQVDVVWTAARSEHPQITSVPLAAFARVGVVRREHEFADAGSTDVETFADQPMLHDRGSPPEWVALWYLADVRPARAARLVEVSARDVGAVLRRVATGPQVTVVPGPLARALPAQLRTVQLTGVPAVDFTATHRRGDRNEAVHALIDAMQVVAGRLHGPARRPGRELEEP